MLPTWIYVIFWVGLAFASVLLGDVFRAFNPWRALPGRRPACCRRAASRWPTRRGSAAGRRSSASSASPGSSSSTPTRTSPRRWPILSLAYAIVQLVGMSLYGIEAWSTRGDAFSVYFGLLARLAPLRWAARRVYRGRRSSARRARGGAGDGRPAGGHDRVDQLRWLFGRIGLGRVQSALQPAPERLHRHRVGIDTAERAGEHGRPARDDRPHRRPLPAGHRGHALDQARTRRRSWRAGSSTRSCRSRRPT